jgi:DNA-binding response OmpR family regulator
MSHILLVEDELALARVVQDSLEQTGYRVTHAMDGTKAYTLFCGQAFDCCIIDVMLPLMDGFTLSTQIRAQGSAVPILFLTARASTQDLVMGYQSGGNDYLRKPFSLEELLLRINELLNRKKDLVPEKASVVLGNTCFIPYKQTLQLPDGQEIKLSHKETELLKMLSHHKNNILERKQALLALWGDDSFFHGRTMDVFVTKLRKHLKGDPSVEILNIRGVGYKLIG